MEKKNLAIIILAVVLAASGIGNVIFLITGGLVQIGPEEKEVLKVAVTSNPVTFEPIETWDSVSNDVLNQIVETLIFFDYPTMTLVPSLALSWSWDVVTTTNITFILRENVVFHDGTPFNAAAVKWNYDRLNWFGNTSGTLPEGKFQAYAASIYFFNETTPIMKSITVNSEYNVTIELSKSFTPFESLLAYTGSSIISPTAHEVDEFIDLATDFPIGTGPYKMVNYEPDQETRFERWSRWWKQGVYFDEVVYVFYEDSVTANNAMLALDIDYLGSGMASLKSTFENDANIVVEEVGLATIYWYVAFNTVAVNITWRKAIHFAFNYTYFLQEIEQGIGIKANSLVPPGFPGHNASVVSGYFDIPQARQFLIDDGIADPSWDVGTQVDDVLTDDPDGASWAAADFRTLKFRTRPGSNFLQLLLAQFTNDMAWIGLTLVEQQMSWSEYIAGIALDPNFMDIYMTGWGPDYFDAFNMIDPLVNPSSAANAAQVNITEINDYLLLASAETDPLLRLELYKTLQYLIHDKYYVNMPLEYENLYVVHAATLKGFPYNINRDLYWYPTYEE